MAAASMNRAGKLKLIAAREIVTWPSSRGCRSTSSTLRGNSGNSSRNSTPLCASDTSPGRGIMPPPISPASEIVWCGDRNGRLVTSPSSRFSTPATEWILVAGVLNRDEGLVTNRPFRSPHHTISDAGLIGGGMIPRPGEVSLAHNGVLFLDELPEFPRNVLEVLRQPLEDGNVTIARAAMSLSFPARFMLAAAMNPCPCGYFNDKSRECLCTPPMIQRYVSKVSGPLLDRIDIHIEVPAVQYKELRGGTAAEGSAEIRERVLQARERQHARFLETGDRTNGSKRAPSRAVFANAQMSTAQIRQHCELASDAERLLERAMVQQGLSARAHDRILKVARTVADLEGAQGIAVKHIAEAIQYRTLDRSFWTHR